MEVKDQKLGTPNMSLDQPQPPLLAPYKPHHLTTLSSTHVASSSCTCHLSVPPAPRSLRFLSLEFEVSSAAPCTVWLGK